MLVGGGHSHVQVMKMFAMKGPIDVKVTMIADSSTAFYSGMLPGCVAGLYEPSEIQMELRPLAEWAGARFIHAQVTGIDPDQKKVFVDGRPPISYDVVSINVGSTTRGTEDIPGVKEYALTTRPINRLLDKLQDFERNHPVWKKPPRIIVAGAGPAGIELSFGLYHRFSKKAGSAEVTLIDSYKDLLPKSSKMVRRVIVSTLKEKGIRMISDTRAERVEQGRVHLSSKEAIDFDLLIWATGGAAPGLTEQTGLKTDEEGFLKVKTNLQTPDYPDVFAAGDCIHLEGHDLPKAGVYAVRQGPVLARNLINYVMGRPLEAYDPQPDFLALLMTGDGEAIASRNGVGLKGKWLWRLKDRIDRKWMARFDPDQLGMDPQSPLRLPGERLEEEMRCSGCAAKVGASVLEDSLCSLEVTPNKRVKIGLDFADDAAVTEIPAGKLVVQTVDYFRAFIDDPYILGRVITIHSASDIFAMGAQPDTAMVIATLPFTTPQRQGRELGQLMAGINFEAHKMNVTIIGGHTSEGAEMSVGLVVNGLVDESRLARKGGLEPGDLLVLTKPLGSAVLMAANMRLKAKGEWIDEAIENMLISNGPAADVFSRNNVRSMTDITGFGLAGHLAEMLKASEVGAKINLNNLQFLNGAAECLEAGIQSSLAPDNRKRVRNLGLTDYSDLTANIIFDPQTSGGLLAGVNPNVARKVVEELKEAGCERTTIIGQVTEKAGELILTRKP